MNYRVFDEKEKGKEIFFKLVQDGGTIDLRACDGSGDELSLGSILSIHEDGKILVYSNIHTEIGIKSVQVPCDLEYIKD